MSLKSLVLELEDYELAFLYKYRYNEFLNKTKSYIDDELKKRGLTEKQLKFLIQTKFDEPIFKTIFLALFMYIFYELFFLLFQNFDQKLEKLSQNFFLFSF